MRKSLRALADHYLTHCYLGVHPAGLIHVHEHRLTGKLIESYYQAPNGVEYVLPSDPDAQRRKFLALMTTESWLEAVQTMMTADELESV